MGAQSSAEPLRSTSGLSVCIDNDRLTEPGPYREYRICVTFRGHTWHVWRRYSQFDALRSALCGGACARDVRAVHAPLPRKGFFRLHANSSEVAFERAPELDRWLSSIVANDASLNSPSLLAFLGLLDTQSTSEVRCRAPLHVRALINHATSASTTCVSPPAESGDVMLFRTRAAVPALQRAVTGSRWDHVGVLIFRDSNQRVCPANECGCDGSVGVLECDAAGTKFYSLRHYELAWHLQYEEICLRPLLYEGRGDHPTCARSRDLIRKLRSWYESVLGSPYELSVGKLLGVNRSERSTARNAQDSGRPGSYLVAEIATHKISVVGNIDESAVSSTTFASAATDSRDADDADGNDSVRESNSEENEQEATQGFFCSELVAHAYQAMGVLPAEIRPASGYWPVDFGEEARRPLPFVAGIRWGDEVPIEFTTPACGGMRASRRHQQSPRAEPHCDCHAQTR